MSREQDDRDAKLRELVDLSIEQTARSMRAGPSSVIVPMCLGALLFLLGGGCMVVLIWFARALLAP